MPPWANTVIRHGRELIMVGRRHTSQYQRCRGYDTGTTLAAGGEIGREVPVPISEEDCVVRPSLVLPHSSSHGRYKDCFNWEYGDFPEGGLTSERCAVEPGARSML